MTAPEPSAAAAPDRRLRRFVAVVLGVFAFGFAALFAVQRIADPDTWWHLRTGQWILENGAVPDADPFSFTVPGAPWLPR